MNLSHTNDQTPFKASARLSLCETFRPRTFRPSALGWFCLERVRHLSARPGAFRAALSLLRTDPGGPFGRCIEVACRSSAWWLLMLLALTLQSLLNRALTFRPSCSIARAFGLSVSLAHTSPRCPRFAFRSRSRLFSCPSQSHAPLLIPLKFRLSLVHTSLSSQFTRTRRHFRIFTHTHTF